MDGVDPRLHEADTRDMLAKETFKTLDVDQDGYISIGEFKRGCMRNEQLAKLLTWTLY